MSLSHIYRALSSTIKAPPHTYYFSSSSSSFATASSSSLAQRQLGMAAIKEFVDKKIADNKIVVFSKSYCPFCSETKDYFASRYPLETVEVVEVDEQKNGSAIQDYLKEKTGARSVPRTFISGKSVGGNDDLQAKSKKEVDELIAKRS
ncbi:thioredoxin-like protein [Boletus coccyginus]|nr:thioredoxin-like protein [Boletus coccyginus]